MSLVSMTGRVVLMILLGLLLAGCGKNWRTGSGVASGQASQPEATGRTAPTALFIEFVPTPQDVVERMLKLARVRREDVVYDLGCGDGRIVVTAARRYGCQAVGYDLDPLRVQEAREKVARSGVGALVTIEQKDVLHADFSGASVVTLYLGPEINARLLPQLARLRPGARIVSHDFPLADLPPDQTVTMTSRFDGARHTLYLWTCPLAPTAR